MTTGNWKRILRRKCRTAAPKRPYRFLVGVVEYVAELRRGAATPQTVEVSELEVAKRAYEIVAIAVRADAVEFTEDLREAGSTHLPVATDEELLFSAAAPEELVRDWEMRKAFEANHHLLFDDEEIGGWDDSGAVLNLISRARERLGEDPDDF